MVSSVSGPNLLSYYQGQTALSLLGASGTATGASSSASAAANAATSNSAILNYLTAKEGIPSAATTTTSAVAPTAPWNKNAPAVSAVVQAALSGAQFVDPSSAKLDAPAGVNSADYKNLFALYQGLSALNDIATTAAAAGTSSASSSLNYSNSQLQSAFSSGISQVQNFLSNDPFSAFGLVAGKISSSVTSTVGVPNGTSQNYTTGVIGTADRASPLPSLQGPVQFSITVASKYANTTITQPDGTVKTISTSPPKTVNIDLSNLGSKPRTIDNVVNYINAQLTAAGVSSHFSVASLGNATTTTTVNGKATTTTGLPQWGFTVNTTSSETVSFAAPNTAAAVYVGMATGGAKTTASASSTSTSTSTTTPPATTPTGEQLLKLQTGNDVVGTAQTVVNNTSTNANLPVGGVFAKNLPEGVTSVQASATGSDGSVYLLANASGSLNGTAVPGNQGVALLKYDASGKLLYSKILAGEQNANGYSLAVNSTDGSVAVAGTNTTASTTSVSGLTKSGATSAFVQVFDATGAPSWSQTIPALAGASAASGVQFGSDGSVYVSGATTGSVGNQIEQGDADEFIQGFDKTGKATFTNQFGAKGGLNSSAGMAYDSATNTLYTVGTENGAAVVRSFSVNATGPLTPVATRSLGPAVNVVGIGLSGGNVVVAGNVSTSTIHAANVTTPYTGVADGFVATISTGLAAQPTDTVTYLGQAGTTQVATGLAVAGGQAYVTGTIANDPNSVASVGATEGFVTGVDTSTGAITYSKKFAGANGQASPTAISVATTGSSVLDQLGLAQGTINAANSGLITAATSVKAGDSFYIRTSPGGPQTQITITAKDTLATLTTKINAVLHASGKAAVVALGATSQLSITPTDSSDYIELDSQKAAQNTPYTQQNNGGATDVLAALGLSSGVIRQVAQINGLTNVKQLREYGLNLPGNLTLNTTANAQHASNAIQAAMVAVKNAYNDLVTPPTMASEQAAAQQSSGGTVPAYLTKEISNYQAGLNRLLGSQSTSSSSSSGGLLGLF